MPPLKFRKSDLTEQVAFRCMGIRGQEQGSIFSRVRRIRQPDPAGSGRKLELPDRLRRARRPTAPRLQKIAPNCPKIAPNRPKSPPASGISGVPAKPPDRIRHALQTDIEPWLPFDTQQPTSPIGFLLAVGHTARTHHSLPLLLAVGHTIRLETVTASNEHRAQPSSHLTGFLLAVGHR